VTIQTRIEVDVSAAQAFELWSDFTKFPNYFRTVTSVTPSSSSPGQTHWVVEILGVEREFDVAVTAKIPGSRIAWATTEGTEHSGVVTFEPLDDRRCEVELEMEFEPEGLIEQIADKTLLTQLAADYELGEFKTVAEQTA